jgi:hypothetical protein
MKIVRDGNIWRTDTNNAFISFTPEASRFQQFWCQDNKDFVYGFEGLLDGSSPAPAYMQRIAKRVRKDLVAEGVRT